MRVEITRTTPVFAPPRDSGVFVQWVMQDLGTSPAEFTFSLDRAESPTGPFTQVVSGLTEFHYFDKHVRSDTDSFEAQNLLSLRRTVYYRVVATSSAGTLAAVSEVGDRLPHRIAAMRRKIQRDIAVMLRAGAGLPFAILKRRHWGRRCPRCLDKVTKTVLDSKCPVCAGTGFQGAYHEPVRITARKGVTNVQTSVAPGGVSEVNQLDFTMLDYPLMAVDDVIVEIHTDRRFVVRAVTQTELRGVPVHQKLVMSELARDNVAYSVLVGNGASPTLY